MPSRIGESITLALRNNKVSQAEVKKLIETAKAEPKWTAELKGEVSALLSQHGDKFNVKAKADLQKFLDAAPVQADLPDPTVLTKHSTIAWNPVKDGQLYVDSVNFDDVIQGSIANCYMASAFSSLAHANPDIVKNAIKDNNDGTYTVRFFEQGGYGKPMKAVHITVDSDMASSTVGGRHQYTKARETTEQWPSVLEKAYAQWKGGYEAIGNGGRSGEVFTALTGKSSSWSSTGTTPEAVMYTRLTTALGQGKPVSAGTHGKDSGVDYNGTGVYAWHAYSVTGTSDDAGEKYVHLRNPWGRSEHGSDGKDDGLFKMKLGDFMKLYSSVYVGG